MTEAPARHSGALLDGDGAALEVGIEERGVGVRELGGTRRPTMWLLV
jgi:hypothetical protein